jgi:hypothetical protein
MTNNARTLSNNYLHKSEPVSDPAAFGWHSSVTCMAKNTLLLGQSCGVPRVPSVLHLTNELLLMSLLCPGGQPNFPIGMADILGEERTRLKDVINLHTSTTIPKSTCAIADNNLRGSAHTEPVQRDQHEKLPSKMKWILTRSKVRQ